MTRRPRLAAVLAAVLALPPGSLGTWTVLRAQAAAAGQAGTAGSGQGDALTRIRGARSSAEQAMANATTDEAFFRASDALRQATAAEIAASTSGMTPDAASAVVNRLSQEAAARQRELGRTGADFLRNRLSSATSDADKAAVFRTFDATLAQVRIAQEVADEAARRLNPVTSSSAVLDNRRQGPINSTQSRMEVLLEQIVNNQVEQPRLPSYTNPDGSRATSLDREIEEHLRAKQRETDIQEYMRLAESGVFVDPATGQPVSPQMRDRIAKNAKLQLADVLKTRNLESGVVRTLLGWTDSRGGVAEQIESGVRNNNWYSALDFLNPSVTGADPQTIARAMAQVLRLSANEVYAWRTGQIPEGGNGGVTGWLYENFWAKQQVGLATASRIGDLREGGEIDRQIEAYTKDVDAAVAALNEMARTPDPSQLSPESLRLLERMGFITRTGTALTYRLPTAGDAAARLRSGLLLPGESVLDMVSAANVMKLVVMVATPELAAARLGAVLEGLGLGATAIGTGEFITTVLMNAALDAGFQRWETGTVQWDRVVLDAVVVNLGLAAAGQVTGAVARSTVTGLMTADARALVESFASNRKSREMAEWTLAQLLGLSADTTLLTYWQGKVQGTGMSYDDFLGNLLNGVIGRFAPLAPNAIRAAATATGRATLWAGGNTAIRLPRSIREAILGTSPVLRELLLSGVSAERLRTYLNDERVATQLRQRQEAIERVSRALGDDVMRMDLSDPRLIEQMTGALEKGETSFSDLKAVLGENQALASLMDGINAYRLRLFKEIIAAAKRIATGAVQAEYLARLERFRENLKDTPTELARALADLETWRANELKKLADDIEAPGSKNNTSDIDRSITSAFLRNALKVAVDEVFRANGATTPATSARAYDVNEYFHIFKVIDRMLLAGIDLGTATHVLADGTTITHGDLMEAMGLATAMMEMPAAQRQRFKEGRTATRGPEMERLFRIAEDNLSRAQSELDTEVRRLIEEEGFKEGPDTITRARDSLYGKRATELAQKEATLARLDPASESYRRLAAEIEADWAMAMREGIEAYTNFTGLDIIVKKAQMNEVSTRELIEGTVDQAGLDAANGKRRKDGKPERTATQQQQLIDKMRTDMKRFATQQLTGALDDQIRFIVHHLNAFFEGHESATQAGAALSKYAERCVLLLQLTGVDITTGPAKALNDAAGALVKNRGNLSELKKVITGLGGGDEIAGIRRLADLLEQVVPGLKGLFDPSLLLGLTPTGAPTPTSSTTTRTTTNSAALAALRRERNLDRERVRRISGSRAVADMVREEKALLEQELVQLKAQQADDARMATQYNRSDWSLARRLDQELIAVNLQVSTLPFTKYATPTLSNLLRQASQLSAGLQGLKSRRTATGTQPTEADRWRERRIASLEEQVQEAGADITRYDERATTEAADAAARVQTGNTSFHPLNDLQRGLAGADSTPSSTPALDALGKALADTFADPPLPSASPVGSANPIVTGGLMTGGGSISIAPTGLMQIMPPGSAATYPGLFGPDGGFLIYAPGTLLNPALPAPPGFMTTTGPSALPTGGMTTARDGTVTYTGVPFSGFPGPGATISPLPGSLVFTPAPGTRPTAGTGGPGVAGTGPAGPGGPGPVGGPGGAGGNQGRATGATGGGAGTSGGGNTIGAWPPLTPTLGGQKGAGFGESESFVPNPDDPPPTITDGGNTGGVATGGGLIGGSGGGVVGGDPLGEPVDFSDGFVAGGRANDCCFPGVQMLVIELADPVTVPPTSARVGRLQPPALPWSVDRVMAMVSTLVRAANPTYASVTALANRTIGLPPRLTVQQAQTNAPARASVPLRTVITSTGNSQGDAFDLRIVNEGTRPFRVSGSMIVEPLKREAQAEMQRQLGRLLSTNPVTRRVEGYCVQFALSPPSPGQLFQIAAPAVQQRFKPVVDVLSAARRVSSQLTPDSQPKSYLESVKQYAVWTRLENWDQRKFAQAFIDKTKKTAQAAKANWTSQMESALMSVVPGRWRDIQIILDEATRSSSASQR